MLKCKFGKALSDMVLFVLFPKQLAGPSKKKKVEEDTGPPVCINETKEKRFKDEKNMKVLLFVSMLDILKTIISNKQLILCFFILSPLHLGLLLIRLLIFLFGEFD